MYLLIGRAMPLLQTPGPAPEFTANAFINGSIGNVALRDYRVRIGLYNKNIK
jgi:hypothetical protein